MPYVVRNLIAELCKPEHLTDRNIADRLGVPLEDVHATAATLQRKGIIVNDLQVVDHQGDRHLTWILAHGKNLAANEAFAVHLGVNLDAPIGT